ncbi:hypothetical protein NRP93_003725 [Clostridium botulinum]|nr:hypothetical protein [Clostridium botulinum]
MIKNNKITYKGKPLNYYISFTNANSFKDSIGFMIIIDGKIQSFSIDKKNNSKIIHNEILDPYSLINIPITFSPLIYNNNKRHTICFLAIYNQNKYPNKNIKSVDYYAAPYMCELNTSNYSLDKKNKAEKISMNKKIVNDSNTYSSIIKLDGNNKNNNEFFGNNKINIDTNKKDILFRFAAQVPKGSYSTIIFVDKKPIKLFNNKNYFIWNSSDDKSINFKDFKVPFKFKKGTHQIYSITLPINTSENKNFYESSKISIKVD